MSKPDPFSGGCGTSKGQTAKEPEISGVELQRHIDAEKSYCEEQKRPYFAPSDGRCWSCKKLIYPKASGGSGVTACPHCWVSYCD